MRMMMLRLLVLFLSTVFFVLFLFLWMEICVLHIPLHHQYQTDTEAAVVRTPLLPPAGSGYD